MKRIAKYLERLTAMASLVSVGIVLSASSPSAAPPTTCGQRGEMELALATRFGEMPFSTATAGQNLVKFYVNPSTRSWTVVAVTPDGGVCIFAAGDDFEPVTVSQRKLTGPES
jgi:hypothetical protein